MKKHQLEKLKKDWQNPEKKKFVIYDERNNPKEMEIDLDSSMSIENLKSVLLVEI